MNPTEGAIDKAEAQARASEEPKKEIKEEVENDEL